MKAIASAATMTTAATGAPTGGAKRKSPWRKTCGRYSNRNWNSVSSKWVSGCRFYPSKTPRGADRLTETPATNSSQSLPLRPEGRRPRRQRDGESDAGGDGQGRQGPADAVDEMKQSRSRYDARIMGGRMSTISRVAAASALAAIIGTAGLVAQDDAITKKARGIHERVMTLDTHDDISPNNFTAECNYTQDLGNQVNLPKMVKGGLDASFFIVYVGQDTGPDAFTPAGYDRAYKSAVEKFDAIHRLTETIAEDKIGLALTSADARRIYKSGRKVAFIGVENGYPIGEDISRVKEFYDRGARYMSLAHNGHSQLSDSNTGEAQGFKWNGLSPLGKQVIAEMNRVGIMIDVSHPSKESMMQTLALTKAPIIASHSSVRKLANHSRNLDDEQLLALKKNGGVMQTVAFSSYVKVDSAERVAALNALRKEFGLPDGAPLTASGGRGGGGGGGRRGAKPRSGGGAQGGGGGW